MSGETKSTRVLGRGGTILTAFGLIVALANPGNGYPRPGETNRVSMTHDGSPAIGQTGARLYDPPVISENQRYVAFASDVLNVVPGLVTPGIHVYRRDLKTGVTELVSSSSAGTPALPTPPCPPFEMPVQSDHPSISGDGRFISFNSCASNLVNGDTNMAGDVFVKDMKTGRTQRVSVASDGDQGTTFLGGAGARASHGSLSSNSRFVTFASTFDNLVKDDNNEADPANADSMADMFIHDRVSGRTELLTVSSRGEQGTTPEGYTPGAGGYCSTPAEAAISATGRFVAFMSGLNGLSPDEPDDSPRSAGATNIFLRDRKKETTQMVDVSSDGTPPTATTLPCRSQWPSISSNGRLISFGSYDETLVPNDSMFQSTDNFVHDRVTGRTERVSVSSTGAEGSDRDLPVFGAHAGWGEISGDGRYVVFYSRADNWDPGGVVTPLHSDVFLHDRLLGVTELISRGHGGVPPDSGSTMATVSGRFTVFNSSASNLTHDDQDQLHDVFIRDRGNPVRSEIMRADSRGHDGAPADFVIDSPEGGVSRQGANLYSASLAYRPEYSDVFVEIDLEHMRKVLHNRISPIFYGLRFKVGDKSYEVRATSLDFGTFGLFDCTASRPLCTKVADLRGGYGTTGMRVVFSLPLQEIGLGDGGELSDVKAFSGLGSYLTGASKVLDRVRLN